MTRQFGLGDIWNEAMLLLRPHMGFVLGITALVAAGYILLDLGMGTDSSNIPSVVVGIVVQYLVVERLLAHRLTDEAAGRRNFGAMFVAALLGGLGIVLGLVLLVIPGLVLAAGWMASSGFVVAEGKGGVAALSASWRATAGSRMAIVLAIVVSYLPAFALFIGALAAFESVQMIDGPAAIIVSDLIVSALGMWGWLLGAAVYSLAVPADTLAAEVFA